MRIATAVAAVLDGIAGVYAQWLADRLSHRCVRSTRRARSLIGQGGDRARRRRDGAQSAGTVMGFDDEGRLLVATLGGIEAVVAGEVTLRDPDDSPMA